MVKVYMHLGLSNSANNRKLHLLGQGMVEFALALPIFLILMFGVIEGGRLLFIYSSVMTAGREATRFAAATDNFDPEGCAAIVGVAQSIGRFAGIPNDQITVEFDRPYDPESPDFTSTYKSFCPPEDPKPGDRVKIDIWVDYSPIIPIPGFTSFKIESISTHTLILGIEPDR